MKRFELIRAELQNPEIIEGESFTVTQNAILLIFVGDEITMALNQDAWYSIERVDRLQEAKDDNST